MVIDDLSVKYNNNIIFQNISFSLDQGQTCSILGPSGCGKTTLLMAISKNVKPFSGNVLIKDDEEIAYVFQNGALFPWKTVEENILLDATLKGLNASQEALEKLLVDLKINECKGKLPHQLSKGQRQRVALARVLLHPPQLLLLDEPLSALDYITKQDLIYLLFELQKKYGFSLLLVTHSIEEAIYLGQRIFILGGKPSKIIFETEANKNLDAHYDQNIEFQNKRSEIKSIIATS